MVKSLTYKHAVPWRRVHHGRMQYHGEVSNMQECSAIRSLDVWRVDPAYKHGQDDFIQQIYFCTYSQ